MATTITRRQFGVLAAGGAAVASLGLDASQSAALETAAITWVSSDPHLSGNFAPVGPELDVPDLPVTAGQIPSDLRGAYMRNGPNPLYKPIAFAYPMDGDGMIHAVYFDNGRAHYRNRFVQTAGLTAERRVGHAIYGSFTHPVPIDPKLLQPGDPPGPFKNGAFISILQHGGKLLALDEATTAYEMTMDLDTLGEWKAGTDQPIRLGAHNRRHPQTGALFTLAYSPLRPVVDFHQIDATGNVARSFSIALAAPTMIHDFVLTEQHIVLFACPAVFDAEAARQGQPFLQWRPDLGTRIGLIALDGSATQWVDADPFFVFHFANAFERSGQIVVDYVRHDALVLGYSAQVHKPPTLHRMTIDIAAGKTSDVEVAALVTEFPRVNDALNALPTRFVYLPTLTDTLLQANPPSATFNTMMRIDSETGDVVRHDFGNKIAGEATFIPRGTAGEDDGILAVFAFDPVTEASDLVLLDAAHVDSDPVAVIRLPQRVPQGLHGNWMQTA
ncbi:MAG TPA: carotenoid oxygenase family protein [Hypericibacter adhaerens]|uniref:carotenoid oxygenase family protein n=1 Tax=Hypericibacter adhaerens TaxID=2602016 RepID=UPI002CA83AB0|nr:carotenoid oxygenase family protein [Hypericibacter adhaerens]HWA46170.1 carotenoid oxygenase family protein [Hypericibacter adhaerens]